jgi:hypothetical protein
MEICLYKVARTNSEYGPLELFCEQCYEPSDSVEAEIN